MERSDRHTRHWEPSIMYGISDYWRCLFLWAFVTGGLLIVPVPWESLRIALNIFSYPLFLVLATILLFSSIHLTSSELFWFPAIPSGLFLSYGISTCGSYVPGIIIFKSPALLITGAAIAIILVKRIERPWHIAVACIVGFAADLWSVFSSSGVTNQLMEKAPEFMNYLLLDFPFSGGGFRPIMGVADFAFLGIIVLNSDKFSMDGERAVKAGLLSLILTLILVHGTGVGLPAIPLMAVSYIVVNMKSLRETFWKDYKNNFRYNESEEHI